jgi:hypothetical protein
MANIFNNLCVNSVLLFVLFSSLSSLGYSKVENENFNNIYNKLESLKDYHRYIVTSREALNVLCQLKIDVETATKSNIMIPIHLVNLNDYFHKNGIYLSDKQIKLLESILIKKTEFKKKGFAKSKYEMGDQFKENTTICSVESDIKKLPEKIMIGVSIALSGMILNSFPDDTFQLVGFTLLTYGTQMTFEGSKE